MSLHLSDHGAADHCHGQQCPPDFDALCGKLTAANWLEGRFVVTFAGDVEASAELPVSIAYSYLTRASV